MAGGQKEPPKVVSIDGQPIVPPGVARPKIVDLASDLLDRAMSGELMGLSVVMYHSDDTHSSHHEGRSTYGTVGCLEALKRKILEFE